jgi:polysaccharide biosynthesis/export protein
MSKVRGSLVGVRIASMLSLVGVLAGSLSAQAQPGSAAKPGAAKPAPTAKPVPPATAPPAPGPSVAVPSDYVIGPEDVLGILFWRDTDMTGDVTVRPDGMITLQLLGDLKAAGLTPDALREAVKQSASKLIEDPSVTVVVKAINSRKVFITGQVGTPGQYPLTAPRTVMQLIALAGGVTEYADSKNIRVVRTENGKTVSFKFNYKDVAKGERLEQNIPLKPGDTVIVP